MATDQRPESDEVTPGAGQDQAYGLGRMLTLSDAVFAFAMTLLVVQLAVPVIPRDQLPSQLGPKLLEQLPTYVSYLISFAVISIYWVAHHRIFGFIRRYDGRLMVLNLGVLLVVAAQPFPTALMGRYGDQALVVVLYAATLGTTGLLITATWTYATRNGRLVGSDVDARLVSLTFWRALATPIVFFLSIPVAVWRPLVAPYTWSLIWVAIVVLEWRYRPHRTRRSA